ncbi:efflux RND transporter periplasmic adaptor subunit [Prevotella melaninogenica]
MKKKISKVWVLVGIVVIAAVAVYLLTRGGKTEEVSFDTSTVSEANIQNSITATGTIEAVTTVTVGTQVSGVVDHLYVDYNSTVKKGQVIAELDKTNLISQLNSAKASLSSAKTSVTSAQDNVLKVQADLRSAEANVNYQRANFNRYKTLYTKGLISATDYENARLTYQQAEASVAAYRQQVSQAQAQVATARQQVAQAQEQVNQAQTNLGYATITSPIDGVVISKSVEEGQTVAASFSTPELFTIAKDLTNMRVIADVDEADIGDVKAGERVSFTVDAYPDDTFSGTVTQVRQNATTTNNVVTYEVVISASNADLKLKPGLTANVTIYTQERTGVLSVPTKALRFTPTKETVGKHYTIQDVSNAKNKVWTLEGKVLKAHRVSIGMTDGTHTQILSGISKGKTVITSISVKTSKEDEEDDNDNVSSPFAPGPKKNKK